MNTNSINDILTRIKSLKSKGFDSNSVPQQTSETFDMSKYIIDESSDEELDTNFLESNLGSTEVLTDNLDDYYYFSKINHNVPRWTLKKNTNYKNNPPMMSINRPRVYSGNYRDRIKYLSEVDDDLAILTGNPNIYNTSAYDISLKAEQDDIIELLEKNAISKSIEQNKYKGSTITTYYVRPDYVYEEVIPDNICDQTIEHTKTCIYKGRSYDTNYIYSEDLNKICPVYLQIPDGYKSINSNIICANDNTISIGSGFNHKRQVMGQAISVNKGSEIIIRFSSPQIPTHIGTIGSYPTVKYMEKHSIRSHISKKIKLGKLKKTNILIKDNAVPVSWCKAYDLYVRNELTKKYIHIGKFNGNCSDHDFKMNDLSSYIDFPVRTIKLVPIMAMTETSIRMSIGIYAKTKTIPTNGLDLELDLELKSELKINSINKDNLIKYVIESSDSKNLKQSKFLNSGRCNCCKCKDIHSRTAIMNNIRNTIKEDMTNMYNSDSEYEPEKEEA
jgi:hypothetical protein